MQSTNTIFLVRPDTFRFNTETALSNSFQHQTNLSGDAVLKKVSEEFDQFATTLRENGILVTVFNGEQSVAQPDAVFPNNWISMHSNGLVILYPMCAPNRRTERRQDLVDYLHKHFIVDKVIDLSGYEDEGRFLEGTGSIVFDHDHQIAYACLSPRTDEDLLLKVCGILGYKPHCFHALDEHGSEIYHTNVMMCIGERFCIVCLDSISDAKERENLIHSLQETGHEIIAISLEQMKCFAGNMLQLKSANQQALLAMSASAYHCLTQSQKDSMELYVTPLPLAVNTIESIGGGSVRCMIAEIFLQPTSDK